MGEYDGGQVFPNETWGDLRSLCSPKLILCEESDVL